MEVYIGLGIFGLFVVGIVAVVIHGKKRKKALKQLADSMNFSFSSEFMLDDEEPLKSLRHLSLFRQGSSQGAWNIMQGQVNDIAVMIMDHRHSTSGSENANVHEQTVMVMQSSAVNLPSFALRPEDLAHKISTAVLGYTDIDFESHPTFSRQYHLHGTNEEAIRNLFNNEVLAYFEQQGNLCVDGDGDTVVVFRSKKTVPLDGIQSFMEQGVDLLNLLKAAS